MSKNWNSLSFDLKEKVVKILDLKSRLRLQQCSTSDHQLVETTQLSLDHFEIFITSTNYRLIIKENNKNYHFDKFLEKNEFENCLKILKSRNFKTTLFGVRNAEPSQKNLKLLIKKFEEIQKIEKINTKTLKFCGISKSCFLELFQIFKCKTFAFDDFTVPRELVDKLVETDGWKGLSAVEQVFSPVNCFRVDDLLHLDRFHFHVRFIRPEDIWKVIMNYRQNPSKFGFSFQILNGIKLTKLLKKFDEPINDEQGNQDKNQDEDRVYTKIFGSGGVEEKDVKLVVKFFQVEGLVTGIQGSNERGN